MYLRVEMNNFDRIFLKIYFVLVEILTGGWVNCLSYFIKYYLLAKKIIGVFPACFIILLCLGKKPGKTTDMFHNMIHTSPKKNTLITIHYRFPSFTVELLFLSVVTVYLSHKMSYASAEI